MQNESLQGALGDVRVQRRAGASIYDADGASKSSEFILNERSGLKTVQWAAPAEGTIYFSIGNGAGGGWMNNANVVYRISIR